MKASRMLISTLKEAPTEAKIDSHILLLRAGIIKNEVAGVYNYLPMGVRVLNKIEDIIREEMNKSGSIEILCSALQPKDLWVESGRWMKYGPELMRLKDRHEREFCLGPTHEEIFTSMARDLIKSSKQLPITLYQIQTKYRDEFRPRFGLMRSREFIMKDAYSFDKDQEGLEKSYQVMYDTYSNIFTRFKLNYQAVLADTGNIGGNGSHQFMALSNVGESEIAYCKACNYAADTEKATSKLDGYNNTNDLEIEKISTPNVKTIEELEEFLKVSKKDLTKNLIFHDFMNEKYVMAIIRGDRDINLIKLCNACNSNENYLKMATDEELEELGIVKGFVGPVGLDKFDIYIDYEVEQLGSFYVGANEKDYHLKNVKFNRDFKGTVCDLKLVKADDLCPECGKPLFINRGIEVGQIFKLQTKYSDAMKCTYVDEKGNNVPMVMGCYGIGVTRTLQSIVEQYHDEFGIKWPLNTAPYHAVIVPINYNDEAQKNLADNLYNKLIANNVEVVLDDRDERPGFKFKDWELIGIPYIITVGRRANEGIVEFKIRETMEKTEKTVEEALEIINNAIKNM